MPATMQAVSATSLIQEEFPDSFRAQDGLEVAKRAKKILGYDLNATTQGNIPPILAAFQEHDFTMYRPQEVELYKEQEAGRVIHLGELGRRIATVVMWFSAIVGVAFGLTFMVMGFLSQQEGTQTHFQSGMWITVISGLSACVVIYFAALEFADNFDFTKGRIEALWQDYPIEDFPDQIPGEVLVHASDIKEVIPSVVFTISKLEVTRTIRRREPRSWFLGGVWDPVLYASTEGDDYRIPVAIWDEPRFSGEPMIAPERL